MGSKFSGKIKAFVIPEVMGEETLRSLGETPDLLIKKGSLE